MKRLYPLLLQPEFRERVWGSRTLVPIYAHTVAPDATPIGEVWLTGDDCRVLNGEYKGRTLGEITRELGRALVGEAAPNPNVFPLLLKFLFPREKLSVQVHPDDAAAKKLNQPCGKTECWYILQAEPGAQIGLGLKPQTTRAHLRTAIAETRAEQLLNWIDVHPGEMFYVDAGTVHAIGAGAIIVETQQNSDTTYRLYDYGRPRELHIESGLAATKETTRAGLVKPGAASNGLAQLVASPCFVVEKLHSRQAQDMKADGSARVLVGLEGCAVIEATGEPPVMLARGEVVIVPAGCEVTIRPQWEIEMLSARVPHGKTAEPETSMPFASLPILNRAVTK